MTPHAIERGAGEAAVLLHGIGGNAALWGGTLDALAGAGRRGIAWDMPGYGASAPLAEPGFAGWSGALVELLDARGVERADLVGHSLGGMIAVAFALAHPGRVRRLVLVATSAAFGGRDAAFRDAFLAARQAPLDAGRGMAGVAADLVPGMLGPAPAAGAAGLATAAMAAVPEATYRATLRALTTFDRRADLPGIAAPTLVVAGGADTTAPPRGMRRMAEAIPGARFVEVPEAGHLLPVERPSEFHAALLGFLDAMAEG